MLPEAGLSLSNIGPSLLCQTPDSGYCSPNRADLVESGPSCPKVACVGQTRAETGQIGQTMLPEFGLHLAESRPIRMAAKLVDLLAPFSPMCRFEIMPSVQTHTTRAQDVPEVSEVR